jgi:hypothetical protein
VSKEHVAARIRRGEDGERISAASGNFSKVVDDVLRYERDELLRRAPRSDSAVL